MGTIYWVFMHKINRINLFECELCKKKDSKTILNKIRKANFGNYINFDVKICVNCCLIQLHNFTNNIKKKNYYKHDYLKDTYNYNTPPQDYIDDQKVRGKKIFNFIAKNKKIFNKALDQLRIIDVGCGTGGTLDYFIGKSKYIVGVDPIINSVKLAKKLGYNVHQGFLEDLKVESNSFDIVILLGTIEHAYDLNKALEECKRILSDNGKIIIRWRSNTLWGSPIEYFNTNHYRYFNIDTFKFLAKKHRLKFILNTNEEIENKPGAEYLILSKEKKFTNKFTFKKDTYKKIIKSFDTYLDDYFKTACNFMALVKKNDFNIEKSKKILKSKKVRLRSLSYSDEHVHRSIIEAREYIKFYINNS